MKTPEPTTTLKSWEEVNLSLRTLGELTMQKRELENSLTQQINEITAAHEILTKPVLNELEAIRQDIEAYVTLHKDEFTQERTKTFSYGSISCRVSKAVKVISKAICLKSLKALNMQDFITVKEEPNKDMLKTLDDIALAKVACEFRVTDNISIEPYIEDLSGMPVSDRQGGTGVSPATRTGGCQSAVSPASSGGATGGAPAQIQPSQAELRGLSD